MNLDSDELDKDAIENAIAKIKNLDIERTSVEEIEGILGSLLNGYQVKAPVFDSGLLIYRGRVCSKPDKFDQIIYPKPENVKLYGRANDINKPIFYASIGKAAPYAETRAKVGDTVAMTYWITKDSLALNHIGFSEETERILNSGRQLEAIYEFVKETKNFHSLNAFVYNFLASQFIIDVNGVGDNYKYKLSVALTNLLLKSPFDGIMYPSIALYGNSDNIVLPTNCVDNKLEFVAVEFVIVKEVNGVNYEIEIQDSATKISDDGSINWSGRLLSWTSNNPFSVKFTNGEWISKDSSGKYILPECNGDIISSLTPLLILYKKEINDSYKYSIQKGLIQDGVKFQIVSTLIYHAKNNSKYLSFYIPQCPNPVQVACRLINDHTYFLGLDKTIEIRKPGGELILKFEDTVFQNIIEVYSEQEIDQYEIIKEFPTMQITFFDAHDVRTR